MTLVSLVATLLVVGLFLWAISALPFIDAGVKKLIYIVVVVVVGLWLVSALGLFAGFPNPRIGR